MEKSLRLTIKKHWFDLIKSGWKTEEYREIKPYWQKRLLPFILKRKPFNILFVNGYSKNSPSFEMECHEIFEVIGNPIWGAPENRKVFVLCIRKIKGE
jgi:hypothetical protein